MKRILEFFPPSDNPVLRSSSDTEFPDDKKARESMEVKEEYKPEMLLVCNDPEFSAIRQQTENNWPDCWTMDQRNEFCKRYDWLSIQHKKLGCITCGTVGSLGVDGIKVAKEWTNHEITYYGSSRQKQLTSLRKKIFEHKETLGHKAATIFLGNSVKSPKKNISLKTTSIDKTVAAKIFRTAYKVAKENQLFLNFKSEIDLQEQNGIKMGTMFHSSNACINIVNHISNEMRKNLVIEIVKSENKISLIIDESTALGEKSTLVIYIRVCFPDSGMKMPVNLFLNLVELESVSAKGVFDALLNSLYVYGITETFLKKNLICITLDGASLIFGRKSEFRKLLHEKFPSVLLWHCANHRLELSIGDTIEQLSGINRFKAFINKLYVLYHASPKNSRELRICANMLEVELLKIGQILGSHWVASSFRSASTVWENYEDLVLHFQEAKVDATRDLEEKCMYESLQRKITSTEFLLDLGLMCDALQELSELSLDLKKRDLDLYKADQKIKALIQVFSERRTISGPYYKIASGAVDKKLFKGVILHEENSGNDPSIDPDAFYTKLKESLEERLLIGEDVDLANCARVLNPEQWPDDISTHFTFGEDEIRSLSTRLQLNERNMIRGFREYLVEKKFPNTLLPLQNALSTIPISSSEVGRGFSQMNLIVTPTRASFVTKTVSSLLFLKLVGPPLSHFDPIKYVDCWLLQGQHSTLDTNVKECNQKKLSHESFIKIWNVL